MVRCVTCPRAPASSPSALPAAARAAAPAAPAASSRRAATSGERQNAGGGFSPPQKSRRLSCGTAGSPCSSGTPRCSRSSRGGFRRRRAGQLIGLTLPLKGASKVRAVLAAATAARFPLGCGAAASCPPWQRHRAAAAACCAVCGGAPWRHHRPPRGLQAVAAGSRLLRCFFLPPPAPPSQSAGSSRTRLPQRPWCACCPLPRRGSPQPPPWRRFPARQT